MQKIGTLAEQVKLSDEEIDALPKTIKFIKHELFENKSGDETVGRTINALAKMVKLNNLEFDPLIQDPTFSVALTFAVAATSATEEEKSGEDYKSRVAVLTKELMERDEKIKKLEKDLAKALVKRNPAESESRYTYRWEKPRGTSRVGDTAPNPFSVTSTTSSAKTAEYNPRDFINELFDSLSEMARKEK